MTMIPLSDEAPSVKVLEAIENKNPWYVGSQFDWVKKPKIKRIFDKRRTFLGQCVKTFIQSRKRPVHLLDLGCGDGYWLYELSKIPGLELSGMDYNPVRVARTREMLPHVTLREGDITTLSTDTQYDIILLNHVIEHVENDVDLLKTIRTFLKPDGMLILGTPNEGSSLQQKWLNRQDDPFITDHVHFYTEPEIRGKIETAGFRIQRVMREVFFLFNDKWYYSLTKRAFGFRCLEVLTALFPRECSGYYFVCNLAT